MQECCAQRGAARRAVRVCHPGNRHPAPRLSQLLIQFQIRLRDGAGCCLALDLQSLDFTREAGLLPSEPGVKAGFFGVRLAELFSCQPESFFRFLESHHLLQLAVFKGNQVAFQRGGFILKVLQLFGIAHFAPVKRGFGLLDLDPLGFYLAFRPLQCFARLFQEGGCLPYLVLRRLLLAVISQGALDLVQAGLQLVYLAIELLQAVELERLAHKFDYMVGWV